MTARPHGDDAAASHRKGNPARLEMMMDDDDWIACDECGDDFRPDELDDGLCDDCAYGLEGDA